MCDSSTIGVFPMVPSTSAAIGTALEMPISGDIGERYCAVAPPAMAGRISRVSASLTGVSSQSCRRTSSSLT